MIRAEHDLTMKGAHFVVGEHGAMLSFVSGGGITLERHEASLRECWSIYMHCTARRYASCVYEKGFCTTSAYIYSTRGGIAAAARSSCNTYLQWYLFLLPSPWYVLEAGGLQVVIALVFGRGVEVGTQGFMLCPSNIFFQLIRAMM